MNVWDAAKNTALRRAYETRRHLALSRETPVNVFDVCAGLGVEVRFMDCKSLEGMYCRDPRCCIVLPALAHRPRGRVAFSCAHELGHNRLGHGTRADEYIEDPARRGKSNPEEYAADIFAAHLLMPRQAVVLAFRRRGLQADCPAPLDVYTVAGELGVGYGSLLTQMAYSLGVLPEGKFKELAAASPKSLRAAIWEPAAGSDVRVVDAAWDRVPVDLQVGEFVTTPPECRYATDNLQAVATQAGRTIWAAVAPGHGELSHPAGPVVARVSRRGYVGPLSACHRPEATE